METFWSATEHYSDSPTISQSTVNETEEERESRTITLSTGSYIVGEDIKAGKYDAIAESGNGNLTITGKNAWDLKVNEIFGVGDGFFDELYTKSFSNVRLEDGDTIELANGLTVLFQAK
jgi:hypothetical protein